MGVLSFAIAGYKLRPSSQQEDVGVGQMDRRWKERERKTEMKKEK